jgi:hypothetical protein
MANVNEDVIRHEDTTANLPSTTRNGQTTYETDLQRRQLHPTADGTKNHWTPDEKFDASIPAYTNIGAPSVTTVKEMLDYLLSIIETFEVIPYSSINLPAVSGVGLLWYDSVNNWLKFRRKSEDFDPNVYVISLSNPIPE